MAAIYCRLSEEDRNKAVKEMDSVSIQNQKSLLLQYAMEQGWDIYQIYSDDDYAGSDRRRPEFNRLLADAENRRFNIILCKTQSRFTRELELVEKYIHGLFPLWNIRFVSVADNADTANKGNKKSRQINGLVNEWYLEDMSESIKSVLDDKRKRGKHIGSSALYGYEKDPENKGHLVIDGEAAAVVREVFTLYSEGWGKTAIARMLNDRGILNPAQYKSHKSRPDKREPDKRQRNKSSSLWSYSTIASMLKNEMYAGNMVQGRYGSVSYKIKQNRPRPREQWYVVSGTHAPIVGRELWERVQGRLLERTRPFKEGRIGLFAGKVFCAGCGRVMRSSQNGGRHYLKCSTRYRSKEACEGAFISVEQLEQKIVEEFNRLASEYGDKDLLIELLGSCQETGMEKERLLSEQAAYLKKAEEFSTGLRGLYFDKVKGILSEQDYAVYSAEFAEEKKRFETLAGDCARRLEALERQERGGLSAVGNPDSTTCAVGNPVSTTCAAGNPDSTTCAAGSPVSLKKLNREMAELLVDSVRVGKRRSGENQVPVEITWNF